MSPRLATALVLVSLLALAGCKAGGKDEPSGYLADSGKMSKQDDFPFHQAWFKPGWNSPDHNSIVVAPVDTSYVKRSDWWKKAEEKGKTEKLAKDLNELADFTQEEFQEAFRKDKNQRYAVVSSGGGGAVILELAIIDVEPNKASLGALGLAATILAAPMGVAILAKETAKGGVAIEGRLRDAETGEVIAMFADRETGKFAPINVGRATSFGEIQKVIREWAAQWVKIANAPPGEKVKDTKTFTLRPW